MSRGTGAVRLVPYGVVGVVPPWNGSMMGMGQKCGPALAAGNTVVAKPPELAPFGMLRFGELALEAGVPPGVLNIVVGGATAGTALAGHPGVDKLTFTGGPNGAGGDGGRRHKPDTARPRARGQVPQHRLRRRRSRYGGRGGRSGGHGPAVRPGLCASYSYLRA